MSELSAAGATYTNLVDAISGCKGQGPNKLPVINAKGTDANNIKFSCGDATDNAQYLIDAFNVNRTKKIYAHLGDTVAMDNWCIITSALVDAKYRFNPEYEPPQSLSDDNGGDVADVVGCYDVSDVPDDVSGVVATGQNNTFNLVDSKYQFGFNEFDSENPKKNENMLKPYLVFYKHKIMKAIFGDHQPADITSELSGLICTNEGLSYHETNFVGVQTDDMIDVIDDTYTSVIDDIENPTCSDFEPENDNCYIRYGCSGSPHELADSLLDAIEECAPSDFLPVVSALVEGKFECWNKKKMTDIDYAEEYLNAAFSVQRTEILWNSVQDVAIMDNFCVITSRLVDNSYRFNPDYEVPVGDSDDDVIGCFNTWFDSEYQGDKVINSGENSKFKINPNTDKYNFTSRTDVDVDVVPVVKLYEGTKTNIIFGDGTFESKKTFITELLCDDIKATEYIGVEEAEPTTPGPEAEGKNPTLTATVALPNECTTYSKADSCYYQYECSTNPTTDKPPLTTDHKTTDGNDDETTTGNDVKSLVSSVLIVSSLSMFLF